MVALVALVALSAGPSYALRTTQRGDGVEIPNSPALAITGDMTLEAWVKPQSADIGGPFHFVVSKNYEGRGFALVLIGSGEDFRFQFEATDVIDHHIPLSVLRESWWHVAGVMEAKKAMTLYVNGVKVAQHATVASTVTSNRPLSIGTSPWDPFTGEIGDVRVWNVARTQEQIVRDMDRRLTGTESGLVADWDFRHRSGRQVFDVTHHTKPGALLGSAKIVRVDAPVRRRR